MKEYVFFLIVMTVVSFGVPFLQAKDFGTRAQTFEIREESFLEMINRRLQKLKESGEMVSLEESVKKRVRERINRPTPVAGISKATENRVHYFDPTLVVENDIRDHKGRLIHAKGTKINPLETISWGTPILLIDGDDETQVIWALQQSGKITLINGAPLQLEETHKRPFYFDQAGILTKKFNIRQVPARISQEGKRLLIEEIKVGE